ncbi:MAG: endonuclease/exonuclease/phosphatase family protein [Candidatus Cryptobacteroides sp.]
MKILHLIGVILLPLTFLSCEVNVKGGEEIRTTPESIEASAAMGSYGVDLTANCAWVAETTGTDGNEVEWITLSKTKGNGSADITVRIFENKYNEKRNAEIVFTTGTGKKATVSVTQAGQAGGEDMKSIDLRVGTYNLRMSSLDNDDPVNKWSVRKERLKTSIKENGFDIFGVQEVDLATQQWLKDNFGSEYECWFFSPYSQAGTGDKAQGILFKKDKLSISDKHFFWASETPQTCSVNDTGSSGNFRRGGHCAMFTHKETGIKFLFMNTHACLNKEPNAKYAYIYQEQEKLCNPNGLPSLFVGDMNARPDYEAPATYKKWWSDSYETAAKKSGATLSYNAFNSPTGKYRIDYIYHRGSIQVKEFCINNKLYDNLYPSDHFPLWADITISR